MRGRCSALGICSRHKVARDEVSAKEDEMRCLWVVEEKFPWGWIPNTGTHDTRARARQVAAAMRASDPDFEVRVRKYVRHDQ